MLKDALDALRAAGRPVLIFGAGARGAARDARGLAGLLRIPVAPTWGAVDLFPDLPDYLCVGGFGTHGTRAANFAVQNADWILSVGARLDSKATGTPRRYFAREAAIFMVDIDDAEVRKFGGVLGRAFRGVQADAGLFLRDMMAAVEATGGYEPPTAWIARCCDWLERYPACPPGCTDEVGANPYAVVAALSELCQPGDVIVSDTGLSLAWLMQAFKFKAGQAFVHALNQTPMGYGLPAAIGAAFARVGSRIILVTGDGGLMLNLQELPVVVRHQLPIKIILLNNAGHGMCRQTQDQWLGGKHYSTSCMDLSFPDFCEVAEACQIAHKIGTQSITLNSDVRWALKAALEDFGPYLLNIRMRETHRLTPQVPYGRPNEDGEPALPRDELAAQMCVGMVEEGQ